MANRPIRPQPLSAPALTAKSTTHVEALLHKDTTTFFGFWMYLMTDLVLFASLFAVFAVLSVGAYGGTPLNGLFNKTFALEETLILLTSSFAAGMALLAARSGKTWRVIVALLVTAGLGVSFLVLELGEFARLMASGNGWQKDGALSAYFTLVATHGLHILIGLVWVGALLVSILIRGLSRSNLRKLLLWSAFWHFLDLVWIFIFTVVYLFSV